MFCLQLRSKRLLGYARVAMTVSALNLFTYTAFAADTASLLTTLQSIEANDASTAKAAAAAKELRSAKDLTLLQTLKAMKNATPVGKNWLSGIAGSLYRKSGTAPNVDLKSFLADQTQDGEARYLVLNWLTADNPSLRSKYLSTMTQDPSPEIRFAAIELQLKSETAPDATQLKPLLEAARHPEQVKSIIEKLGKSGVTVDQSKHFGFRTDWQLIGPFDNVGSKNFDKSFDIESDWVAGNVKDKYPGKSGDVVWQEHKTDHNEGLVDLAAIYNNEKGCIVYAATTFDSPKAMECEIRLGSWNAQKVWLNGQLVLANEVYHTNMQIDQYSAPIKLEAGKNRILIKLCQNEQKEQWAQSYSFQVRISDSTGKAILAKNE